MRRARLKQGKPTVDQVNRHLEPCELLDESHGGPKPDSGCKCNQSSGSQRANNKLPSVGEIIACDHLGKWPKKQQMSNGSMRNRLKPIKEDLDNKLHLHQSTNNNKLRKYASSHNHSAYQYYYYYQQVLSLIWRPTTQTEDNTNQTIKSSSNDVGKIIRRRLDSIKFPFKVLHRDGISICQQDEQHDDDIDPKDFLNKRQFRLTCLALLLLTLFAACSPIEPIEAFKLDNQQQTTAPITLAGSKLDQPAADVRHTRSLSSYDLKDWLPGTQSNELVNQQVGKINQPTPSAISLNDGSPSQNLGAQVSSPTGRSEQQPSPGELVATSSDASMSSQGLAPANLDSIAGKVQPETQLMAPSASSSAPDHMLTAASKKKKKMKMMKKKKKMEKKHKEWKKGKKHKKKKYESKKKKGGSSKKKKGKKEKKKWGMEKKGHKKKGNFKKKKWGSKKKMKKGHKKGKKGHKLLKDKGHKKKGFKKVYHKEEWGKKKKWHDIKREKKWNTKAKKWKKKWHQEKGKKYKGKHMKKYHKKNKHGKKYKKEKKSKWKKHKGEKFKKGHKKKKEEYSKKKEGGKKKKMKKMKKEMKKKKKG